MRRVPRRSTICTTLLSSSTMTSRCNSSTSTPLSESPLPPQSVSAEHMTSLSSPPATSEPLASSSASSAMPPSQPQPRPDIRDMSKYVAPPPATRTQFSFLSAPDHRGVLTKQNRATNGVVPNNDAKMPFPMWSSSLTSPKMELQRMKMDSWIAPHLSAGFHEESAVEKFVAWISERADAAEVKSSFGGGEKEEDGSSSSSPRPLSSYLSYALRRHVQLKLRAGGSCRGVFARRSFAPGDVILSIPTAVGISRPAAVRHPPSTTQSPNGETPAEVFGDAQQKSSATNDELPPPPLWGLTLNSETLRKYSVAAQQRCVPSYDTIWDIVSKRRSSLDPYTHPLFADQIYSALFLACEKEAG
ncbi:GPI-anchored surface protein, putative, partial [Bodo saltans]